MDNASLSFVFFGLIAAILCGIRRSASWRSTVLLVVSIVFVRLVAGSWLVLVPFAGFLALGYISVEAVRRGVPRAAVGGVCILVLAFLWLKKYTFLPQALFLRTPYLTLGLSYVFFRVLHLVIEAAEPENRVTVNPFRYLLYTLNFTTFVSGPIQRYEDFVRYLAADTPLSLDLDVVAKQIERLIRGFFKVNVVALVLHMLHTDAYDRLVHPLTRGHLSDALTVAALYPLFLYANFSGYIDIVIALARLMRVELPENFDRPFAASSFIDFWNRWHITLSTWLKTYVYNPLLVTLMRRFPEPSLQATWAVVCFFVTFFVVGVWHGPTTEFVFFGVLQGGGVALNKITQLFLTKRLGRKGYRAISEQPVYDALARGLTYTWFAFTMFWFWGSWAQIGDGYRAMGSGKWLAAWGLIWLGATVVLAVWEWLRARAMALRIGSVPVLETDYVRTVFATAMAVIAFVMTVVISQPAPELVYKAF